MHLLDGRRVNLADLMDAKLLEPSAGLSYARSRIGDVYHARVLASGRLQLDDGQEFRSPSRAAAVASGSRAVAGWHVWTVDASGETLDVLRRRLLDQVAERSPVNADTPEDQITKRVHAYLRAARGKADSKEPMQTPVRELLSLWGARDRTDQISRIEADLANHGLVTWPSFRKVTLDATVRLLSASDQRDTDTSSTISDEDEENAGGGTTVGNLPSAFGGVESIAPTATMEEAVTRMLLNDFSQLAVMSGQHTLRGAVTWRSIAQARHVNPSARLADAIIRAAEKRYDEELIDVLPDLETGGFIFVRNDQNAVSGIVTTADVVNEYGVLATPFLLIGELDRMLRRIVADSFELDDVVAVCDAKKVRGIANFDDLSMGDYKRVFETPALWEKLSWPLDRAIFVNRLEEMRRIRNAVMHFSPDPLHPETVDRLRNMLRLLREYGT